MSNKRLVKMIREGKIPNRGGVFIDTYNQSINEDIAMTITARINASSMIYVTEICDTKESETTHYRIRKLTPRECFRLMGVDDADIDKIQGSGISNTQMYKLAGNSIVVDTLSHLMRKMFCETKPETQQLTLF